MSGKGAIVYHHQATGLLPSFNQHSLAFEHRLTIQGTASYNGLTGNLPGDAK